MVEIPEDVRKMSWEVRTAAPAGETIDRMLSRAILAERRRCAEVARDRFSGQPMRTASRSAGIEIARAILA